MPSDFFTSDFGTIKPLHWRKYWKLLRALDRLYDWRIAPSLRRMRPEIDKMPPQRLLLAAVVAPGREGDLARVIRELTDGTFQQVTVSAVPMDGRGKYDNINLAIADYDLTQFDWLMIVDDDISAPPDSWTNLSFSAGAITWIWPSRPTGFGPMRPFRLPRGIGRQWRGCPGLSK